MKFFSAITKKLHLYFCRVIIRTLKTSNAIAIDGLEYLKNNYYVDISDYDVVIGYRADDSLMLLL